VKLRTYEQIFTVFNRRHHWHGVYRFVHRAARNNCDYDRTGSSQTDTDAVEDATLQNNRWVGTQA
jgi:hypothetical protein